MYRGVWARYTVLLFVNFVSNPHYTQSQKRTRKFHVERILLYISHRAFPIRNHLSKSSYYAMLRFSQKRRAMLKPFLYISESQAR